jgi:putative ABC transport system ATP-binding protein
MLELRNIGKAYSGGRKVFAGLSYVLDEGAYVAIMGESGVGKSTLLNLIAGLDAPDTGEILIDGTAISSLGDDAATKLRRKELG